MFPVTLATILLWCLFCRTESLGDQEIVFGLNWVEKNFGVPKTVRLHRQERRTHNTDTTDINYDISTESQQLYRLLLITDINHSLSIESQQFYRVLLQHQNYSSQSQTLSGKLSHQWLLGLTTLGAVEQSLYNDSYIKYCKTSYLKESRKEQYLWWSWDINANPTVSSCGTDDKRSDIQL